MVFHFEHLFTGFFEVPRQTWARIWSAPPTFFLNVPVPVTQL